ncbi:hypothetical protein BH10BAC2_BH10BAC2_05610 [soil metagenome]
MILYLFTRLLINNEASLRRTLVQRGTLFGKDYTINY